MKKVVINCCYGGFGLSVEAKQAIIKRKNIPKGEFSVYNLPRDDKDLVQVVEELGEKSWGSSAKLSVIEIPSDVEYTIQDYDGGEWIAEKHRTWPDMSQE